jgi:hypothetical protein
MAKPTGAISTGSGGDFPYVVSDYVDPDYLYFPFRLPVMPPHWNDEDKPYRYKISAKVLLSVSAGGTGYIDWGLDGRIHKESSFSGLITRTWQDIGTLNADQYVKGWEFYFDNSPPAAIASGQLVPDGVRYQTAYARMLKDAGGTSFEIYAFHFALENDDTYTTPSSDHRRAEVTDRTTAANYLHKPNRFCSSWHTKRAMAHTVNKIIHANTTGGITVPVFGGA